MILIKLFATLILSVAVFGLFLLFFKFYLKKWIKDNSCEDPEFLHEGIINIIFMSSMILAVIGLTFGFFVYVIFL